MEYNYCHGSKLKVVRKKQGHRKTIKNTQRETLRGPTESNEVMPSN